MSQPWVPLPYMERAVQHLVERSHAGLFLKPGMRKSSITLAAFEILRELKLAKALLIIAPLRVIYTSWPQELRKWIDFNHLSAGILHGKRKDEVLREQHDIYLINYEGLGWLTNELGRLKRLPFDMLVADESTKLKHTTTQRFKLLKPWLKSFQRRVILTGTPTARHLLDVFGQCYVMDSGQTFGPYITRFREEFFFPTGFGGYTWAPKPHAEEGIHARLAPRVFFADDQDWLQLPDLIEKDIEVELPPKAMAMYRQLETTLRLEFKAGRINAANAAVASMKCRQLANGGCYLDGQERTWQHVHEAKTEAVVDLLDELQGEPALITYDFLHDLERLRRGVEQHLGERVLHIGRGGVTPAKLPGLIAAWQRGDVPALIVSAASLAHGVDGLQHGGKALIWASLTYNWEDYLQLVARLRRSGQVERVLNAHIIARGTIDEAVLASGRAKDKKQGNLFNALKQYWSES